MTKSFQVAACVLIPLLGLAQQTLKVDVDLVNVFISAQNDHGEFVDGLNKDDFAIYEDGEPQQISIFEKDRGVHSAIGILLDTSGSTVDILPYERRGLLEFTKTILHPDEYYVVTFGTNVRMIYRSPDSRARLEQALQTVKAYGTSLLFDAMLYGMDKVNASDNERKALVVFTDGSDNGSNIQFGRIVREAQVSGVLLYFVAIGSPILVDRHTVDSLANESGGRVFYVPKSDQVLPYLEKIRVELSRQYYVGYYTARKPGYHRIKVDLPGRSGITIRTKAGYLVN